MSALLKKPINISKIRAERRKPGLLEQHLTGAWITFMLFYNQ